MVETSVDIASNLLVVTYSGHVTENETRRGADELAAILRKLLPGFRLLTDLTELEKMDLECLPNLNRMMDLSNSAGVDLVVRVIPDPHKDIGLNIMALFHYQKRVRIVTCRTTAEALSVLEAHSPGL